LTASAAWCAKLANPGDDLLTQMSERVRTGEMTPSDEAALAQLFLIAGRKNSANMIALGTVARLEHPEQLASCGRPTTNTATPPRSRRCCAT
jgi:cytochrome P450